MEGAGKPAFESLDGEAEWDEEFAAEVIGRTLLVGISYFEHDGTSIGTKQVFGVVEVCSLQDGIHIREANGEIFIMPPMLDCIEHGDPGIYQMTENDDEVEDPDFTARVRSTHPLRS